MNQEDASLGDVPPTLLDGRLIAWSKVEASIRNVDLRAFFRGKVDAYASTLSPLILALIVVGGLGTLCIENLGGAGARHISYDHSEAILKLLFRN